MSYNPNPTIEWPECWSPHYTGPITDWMEHTESRGQETQGLDTCNINCIHRNHTIGESY